MRPEWEKGHAVDSNRKVTEKGHDDAAPVVVQQMLRRNAIRVGSKCTNASVACFAHIETENKLHVLSLAEEK